VTIAKSGHVTFVSAPLPLQPLPHIPPPEVEKPEDEMEQWWTVQIARVDKNTRVYKDYIAAHPTEFKLGDHIIIIDDETVLHRFDTYDEAMEYVRRLAGDKGYCHVEYGHENDKVYIYNVVEGQFKDNSLPHVNLTVKRADDTGEEYKVEMVVDTGANGCIISEQLARQMNLRLGLEIDVGTAGLYAKGYGVEVMYGVDDWGYKKNIRTIVIPRGQSNLLGMSYLRHCHGEWWGNQKINLRLLEENERPDVNMNPGLLSSMEKLSLNLHVEQEEVARLKTESTNQTERIQELEDHLRMALQENKMLEMLVRESDTKHKTHRNS
jgi:predicted aspartyl protease